MMSETIGLIEPTEADVDLARRQHDRLMRAVADANQPVSMNVPFVGDFDLSPAVVRAVIAILHEFAQGNSVSLQSVDDEELSTTEAAGLLGMSRPTLINLLEAGAVPYRWVGSHRRVRRSAVLAQKARMARGETGPERPQHAERLRGLEEMAETTHRLGQGY